jgi:hypothetical protein
MHGISYYYSWAREPLFSVMTEAYRGLGMMKRNLLKLAEYIPLERSMSMVWVSIGEL